LTLLGSASMTLEATNAYSEPGFTSVDCEDGNVAHLVTVTGTVNSMAAAGTVFTLTYSGTDTKGNRRTVTRTVTIVDTLPPIVTLNGASPYYQQGGHPYVEPGARAADLLNGDLTGSISISGTVRVTGVGVGTTTQLVYSARDVAGNVGTATRTVVIINAFSATLTLLGATAMPWEAAVVFADPGYSAFDIIDGDLTGNVVVQGSVLPFAALGTVFTLSYDVINSAMRASPTQTRTVTLRDTTPPVITINGPSAVTVEAATPYVDPGATAMDTYLGNITAAIQTVNPVVTTSASGTIFTVTYNVRDSASNAATQRTRTVTVMDTTRPVIVLHGAASITHEGATPYTDAGATAWDTLDGALTGRLQVQGSVNTMAPAGSVLSIHFDVADNAGNAAVRVTRTVQIVDVTIPVLSMRGSPVLVLEAGLPWTDPGCTASDTLDGDITARIVVSGASAVDVYAANGTTYDVRYSVADSAGNNAVPLVRRVIVVDTQAPVITLFGPRTEFVEAAGSWQETGGYLGWDVRDLNITADVVTSQVINTMAPLGTNFTVTYRLQDATGNQAQAQTRRVQLRDTTPPVMTLQGNRTFYLPHMTFYVDPGCDAVDAYSGVRAVVLSGLPGGMVTQSYTLTYTAVDTAGNIGTTQRRVVIYTTVPPTLLLVNGGMITWEAGVQPFVDPGALAYDVLEGAIPERVVVTGTVDVLAEPGTVFALAYVVDNSAGLQSAAQVRRVTIVDTTAPVLALTGAALVEVEGATLYRDAGATAWDSYRGNLTSQIVVSGVEAVDTFAPAGTAYGIQYNVQDSNGNAASTAVRTVRIVDTTAPVLTLVGAAGMSHEAAQAWVDPGCRAMDTLDGNITARVVRSGAVVNPMAPAGTVFTIVYSVSDRVGNAAASVTRTVTIVDTTRPVLTLVGPSSVTVEGATVYADQGAVAMDTLEGDITARMVVTNPVSAMAAAGTQFTVAYTVTDTSGNAAIPIARTVRVVDTTPPVVTLNGNRTLWQQGNATFVDPGFVATDTLDGDVGATVRVTGSVNVNSPVGTQFALAYTATDRAGNNATATRTVVIFNAIAPVITLAGSASMVWEGGVAPFVDPGATAYDVLDGFISGNVVRRGVVNVSGQAGSVHSLTYGVQNSAHLSAVERTRVVTIVDTTRPVISLQGPADLMHEGATAFVDPLATAWDTLDGNVTARITVTGSVAVGAAAGTVSMLQYNVQDLAGNAAATLVRTVTIVDTTRPVITLAGALNTTLEGGVAWVEPGFAAMDTLEGDMSQRVTVTGDTVNAFAAAGSVFLVQYNVADRSGNVAATVTRRVTIVDTQRPVLTLVGPASVTVEGAAAYADQGALAWDALDGDVTSRITVSNPVSTMAAAGTRFTVTYSVSDRAGNAGTQITRTVLVVDTIPPVLTLLGDGTVLQQANTPWVEPGFTAVDTLAGNVASSVRVTGTVNVNSAVGQQFVLVYTARDPSNNAVTATRVVVITSLIAPVITLIDGDLSWEGAQAPFFDPGATAFDAVDGDLSANITVSGGVDVMAAAGTVFVLRYNVGNTAGLAAVTRTRQVTIVDTMRPTLVFNGARNLTHEGATAFVDPAARASDTLDGNLTSRIVTSGAVNVSSAPGTVFMLRYDVQDAAGNAAVPLTRYVRLVDTTRPVLQLLGSANMTLEGGQAWVDPGGTASDTLDGDITARIMVGGRRVNETAAAGTVFNVTYNVTDRAGNRAFAWRRVTVVDTTPPTLVLVGEPTVRVEGNTTYVDAGALATDSLDGNIGGRIVRSGGAVNTNAPAGTQFTLTFTVTDRAGNAAPAVSRVVEVVDTRPPVLTLNGNATFFQQGNATFADPGCRAVDALSGNVTQSIVVSGDAVNVNSAVGSMYVLVYTASDAAGNTASATRTVVIVNRIAPVITLLGSSSMTWQGAVAPFVDPWVTAYDVIDGVLDGSVERMGSVNVFAAASSRFTLSYGVVNSAQLVAVRRNRTVTIIDTTAPVLTLRGASPLLHEGATAYVDPGATAWDSLNGNITARVTTSGAVNVGAAAGTSFVVTYGARDLSNNAAASMVRIVTIVDTTPPVLTLSGDSNVNVEGGAQAWADPGCRAMDTLDGSITARVVRSGAEVNTMAPAGTVFTFVYSVSDRAGNAAATVTRTVTIVDTTRPALTLLGSTGVEVEGATVYADQGALAMDALEGDITARVVVSNPVDVMAPAGTVFTVTYTVTDTSGNAALPISRTVTIVDTTPPVVTLVGDAVVTQQGNATYVDAGCLAVDSLAGNVAASITVTGTVNVNRPVGTMFVLTYTAQDPSGNVASAMRSVRIINEIPPTLQLLGSGDMQVQGATAFVDPGAVSYDVLDGLLTSAIVRTGSVNTSRPAGTQSVLMYRVRNSANVWATPQNRTVTIIDTIAPTITLRGNASVTHEGSTAYTDPHATAWDSLDGNVTSRIVVTGSVAVSVAAGSVSVLQYNVQDLAGNAAATVVRTVTIVDTTRPTLWLLGAVNTTTEGAQAWVDPGCAAQDTLDGNLTGSIVRTGSVNTMAAAGTVFMVTCSVSDRMGNRAVNVSRRVRIVDTTRPVLSLVGPASVTVEGTAAYADQGAVALDSLEGVISGRIAVSSPVNTMAPAGSVFTVTYAVSDVSGNAALPISRTVTVVDTTPPVLTLRGNATFYQQGNATFVDPGCVATDSLAGNVTSSITVSGAVNVNSPLASTYILTYTAQDPTGNRASITRTVVIANYMPPVVHVSQPAMSWEGATAFVDPGVSAYDVLDGDITGAVVVTGAVDTLAAAGSAFTLTYRVVNTAQLWSLPRTRTVTIVDRTPPTLSLVGGASVPHEGGTAYSDAGAQATDSLEGDISGRVHMTGVVNVTARAGTSFVLAYGANDTSGNSAAAITRTVTIVDTTRPVLMLLGAASATVEGTQVWVDPGCLAADTLDGDLSSSVVRTGVVNSYAAAGTVFTIVYSVVDRSGNAAVTKTRTVTVVDTTRPVLTLIGPSSVTLEGATPYVELGAVAVDSLDGNLTSAIQIGHGVDSSAPAGSEFLVTYYVRDSSNNSAAIVTRRVVIVDTTPPVLAVLGNSTIYHQGNSTFVDPGWTATDTLSGLLTSQVQVSGAVNVNGRVGSQHVLVYRVLDAAGNQAVATRQVVIINTIAPVITLVGPSVLDWEGMRAFVDPGATAFDVLDGRIDGSIGVSGLVNVTAPAGTLMALRYNVNNSAQLAAAQVLRLVRIVDTTPPVITLTGPAAVMHEAATPYADAGATAMDSLQGDLTAHVRTTSAVDVMAAAGTVFVVQYNVNDTAGNEASTVTRAVSIVDTTRPVLTLLGSSSMTLEGTQAWVDPGCLASDTLDGLLTSSVVRTGTVDPMAAAGTVFTVVYSVSDRAGNDAVAVTRTVTIVDTTRPVVTLVGPASVTVEGATVYADQGATAADSLEGDITARVVVSHAVNTSAPAGTQFTVAYSASDSAGNAAAVMTRTVMVVDTTPPVLMLVGNATLYHQGNSSFSDPGCVASDTLDGDITASVMRFGAVDVNSAVDQEFTLTCVVSDAAGNGAIVTRKVVIVNHIQPLISLVGGDMVWEATHDFVDPGATAYDVLDGRLDGSISVGGDAVDVMAPAGTVFVRTYDVVNSARLSAVQRQRRVQVVDTTAPVVGLVGDSSVVHEGATAYHDAGATAWDSLDGNITQRVVAAGAVNESAPAGTAFVLQYDASDVAGNAAATVHRTVTIVDTTPPIVTLLGGASMLVEGSHAWVDPGCTAFDSLDGDVTSTVTVTGAVDTRAVAGTVFTLVYSARDRSNNTAAAVMRQVMVVDTTAPYILLAGPANVSHEATQAWVEPGWVATDSLDDSLTVNVTVAGSVNVSARAGSVYELTYSVRDRAGNAAAVATRRVTIVDTTVPTIRLLGPAVVQHEGGTPYVDAGWTATDSLDGDLSAQVVSDGSTAVNTSAPAGSVFAVSYTVRDAAGNAAAVQTRGVVIVDTTAPVITLHGAATVVHEAATAYVDGGASAWDSLCGSLTHRVVRTGSVDVLAMNGTLFTLTYTVTDDSGNAAASVSRVVMVRDSRPPVVRVHGAAAVSLEGGMVYRDAGAVAFDSRDGNVTTSIVVSVGAAMPAGAVRSPLGPDPSMVSLQGGLEVVGSLAPLQTVYTVTYRAWDAAGNSAVAQRTVRVVDTLAPRLSVGGEEVIVLRANSTWRDGSVAAFDAYSGDLSSSVQTVGEHGESAAEVLATKGLHRLFYTVSDAAGNTVRAAGRLVHVVHEDTNENETSSSFGFALDLVAPKPIVGQSGGGGSGMSRAEFAVLVSLNGSLGSGNMSHGRDTLVSLADVHRLLERVGIAPVLLSCAELPSEDAALLVAELPTTVMEAMMMMMMMQGGNASEGGTMKAVRCKVDAPLLDRERMAALAGLTDLWEDEAVAAAAAAAVVVLTPEPQAIASYGGMLSFAEGQASEEWAVSLLRESGMEPRAVTCDGDVCSFEIAGALSESFVEQMAGTAEASTTAPPTTTTSQLSGQRRRRSTGGTLASSDGLMMVNVSMVAAVEPTAHQLLTVQRVQVGNTTLPASLNSSAVASLLPRGTPMPAAIECTELVLSVSNRSSRCVLQYRAVLLPAQLQAIRAALMPAALDVVGVESFAWFRCEVDLLGSHVTVADTESALARALMGADVAVDAAGVRCASNASCAFVTPTYMDAAVQASALLQGGLAGSMTCAPVVAASMGRGLREAVEFAVSADVNVSGLLAAAGNLTAGSTSSCSVSRDWDHAQHCTLSRTVDASAGPLPGPSPSMSLLVSWLSAHAQVSNVSTARVTTLEERLAASLRESIGELLWLWLLWWLVGRLVGGQVGGQVGGHMVGGSHGWAGGSAHGWAG
jgi:large repetitive protein